MPGRTEPRRRTVTAFRHGPPAAQSLTGPGAGTQAGTVPSGAANTVGRGRGGSLPGSWSRIESPSYHGDIGLQCASEAAPEPHWQAGWRHRHVESVEHPQEHK